MPRAARHRRSREIGGSVDFAGQQTTEVIETVRLTDGTDRIDVVTHTFQRRTAPAEVTHDGAHTEISMTRDGVARSMDMRSVFEPPFVDRHHALRVGESVTQTMTGRGSGTVAGVVTPEQQLTTRTTVRFLGVEPVTVPAGTGPACLFEEPTEGQHGSKRRWVQIGHRVTLKEVTTTEAGTETKEAIAPLRPVKR